MVQLSLEPIANEKLFSRHYLEDRLPELDAWDCDAEAEKAFNEIKELYQSKDNLEQDNEKELQREFIEPILKILGHVFAVEEAIPDDGKTPDFAFFRSEDEKQDSKPDSVYESAQIVGDAKRWNVSLDKDIEGEPRFDNKNPSFQLYYYLTNTDAEWGILTNGKKWRLFYSQDAKVDTYYEIDLEQLIAGEYNEQFKYFYCFFRRSAFYPEKGTTSFLEKVHSQSVEFAQELEDDLKNRVYSALRYTVEGFLEAPQNELGEDDLKNIHENSLTFLYRLLFVLYAESRDLLPHENKVYHRQHSLAYRIEQLGTDEEDNVYVGDFMWRHLSSLFETINEGREVPSKGFSIPAYNGGLFDPDENPFLEENLINGPYLKEIIERLALAEDEKGNEVRLDYKDLDIRHLGSIYEGLLEYQPRVADSRMVVEDGEWIEAGESDVDFGDVAEENRAEQGEVYLETDKGERKATGSYYTPQYIVEYIVENTVGPMVEEKVEEAEEQGVDPAEKILDLKVCDPAMGSGHFLVEAVSFLATHLLEHTEEMTEDEDAFQEAKRRVVKQCVYGVDVNPMATSLAKLSLWLETAAKDRPLSFLDHHLKTGNSLIGADLDELRFHPDVEDREEKDLEQFNIFVEDAKEGLESQYRKIARMPEDTIEEIHEKEEAYREFLEENERYHLLKELANVYTYQYFDGGLSPQEYRKYRSQLYEKEKPFRDEPWFVDAQKDSEQQQYFHWPLEFPDVFFRSEQGFDVVVGNPPYFSMEGNELQAAFRHMYSEIFTGDNDVSHFFLTKGSDITQERGLMSYIITRYWLESTHSNKLRGYLARNCNIKEIVDFRSLNVWPDVGVNTVIITLGGQEDFSDIAINRDHVTAQGFLTEIRNEWEFSKVDSELLDTNEWYLRAYKNYDLWQKVRKNRRLKEIAEFTQGIKTGKNPVFLVDKETVEDRNLERDALLPVSKSKQVKRYRIESDKYLIYTHENFSPGEYPNIMSYLKGHRNVLENRAEAVDRFPWWRLQRPRDGDLILDGERILVPYYSKENSFAHCYDPVAGITDVYMIFLENAKYSVAAITAILNSTLMNRYYSIFTKEKGGSVLAFSGDKIGEIPIPEISKEEENQLRNMADSIKENYEELDRLNFNISDYLTTYQEGKTLGEISIPSQEVGGSILSETLEDKDNLRIGSVETEINGDSITLLVSARYKPKDNSSCTTDPYGYTETDLISVMEFHDLSEIEKALIKEFVPVAVDEAGGFANFRETATKTKSLIDRLEELTLPKLSEVEKGLKKYLEVKDRGEELDRKIEETDELIDDIVYDLYGLDEEEIEIVENSVKG